MEHKHNQANTDMASVSVVSQDIFHLQRLQKAMDLLEYIKEAIDKLHDLSYLFQQGDTYAGLTQVEIIEAMCYNITDMQKELQRLAEITALHLARASKDQ
jgi:hypothetical protein